jgi:molecular chaperone DnaK (HSP70)
MIVGIDLGTTNSLLAGWENGAARLIPNSLGDVLTPSCVSVDDDGTILVGQAARERLQTHPQRSAAAFKRDMSSDKMFQLGGHAFRAEELAALILRALMLRARRHRRRDRHIAVHQRRTVHDAGAAIFMLCLMVLMVVSTKLKWFAPAAAVQDSGQRR